MQRACYWFLVTVRAQVQSGDGTGSLPAVLYLNTIEANASLKQYSCWNKLALGQFKVVYLFILHELEK